MQDEKPETIAIPAKPVRLVLAVGQDLARVGTRRILSRDPAIELAGEATTAAGAIDLLKRLSPDVILLGTWMSRGTPHEVCRWIRDNAALTRVVVLIATDDESACAPPWVRSDVSECLPMSASGDELRRAVREATRRSSVQVGPSSRPQVARGVVRSGTTRRGSLTMREQQVLEHIGKGLKNDEIARSLCIARKTVESHIGQVLLKLGVRSRTEAALWATKQGWL